MQIIDCDTINDNYDNRTINDNYLELIKGLQHTETDLEHVAKRLRMTWCCLTIVSQETAPHIECMWRESERACRNKILPVHLPVVLTGV